MSLIARLVTNDFATALRELGEVDIATAYLTPEALENPARRIILDLNASLRSAPDAVSLAEWLIQRIERVRHVTGLHAKVALGPTQALIGSANFTHGGLMNNIEVGVVVSEPLDELRAWYEDLWSRGREIDPDKLLGLAREVVPQPRSPLNLTCLKPITAAGPVRQIPSTDDSVDMAEIADDLVEHLTEFVSVKDADVYLTLGAKIIRELGPDHGGSRLSVTLPKTGGGPRINVGTTWVLLPGYDEDDEGPFQCIELLLPHDSNPENGVELGRLKAGTLWSLPMREDVLERTEGWREVLSELVRTSGLQRQYHREDALRAMLDLDYRARVLEAVEAMNLNVSADDGFPGIVQYWKETSFPAVPSVAEGSIWSKQVRLLDVEEGGDVWLVTLVRGRLSVGGYLRAERYTIDEEGRYHLHGQRSTFFRNDDEEFLGKVLELDLSATNSNRSQQLRTIRHLTVDQNEAFRRRFGHMIPTISRNV